MRIFFQSGAPAQTVPATRMPSQNNHLPKTHPVRIIIPASACNTVETGPGTLKKSKLCLARTFRHGAQCTTDFHYHN
jgi:hypothetical protein